ncbi:unnamed protein product [Periconia digitata]|uniref:Ap4A phosphorylase II n=1 Tax=Periconia digitata TaxID=1303443 RepID=A0A9W4XKN9_9PLEO|nr:unnamed protein product [Periconia digitata]
MYKILQSHSLLFFWSPSALSRIVSRFFATSSTMNLETKALAAFDRLVQSGELLWKETAPRHVPSSPFNFEFRVAASLAKKPRTAHQKKVVNAFADDNPDFSLGLIGPNHKLILNKFCVVRPQFVLHTVEFVPQQRALDSADLGSLWHVLQSLQSEHIAIFNCGVDAGASVGHKHMQILPHPGGSDFQFFPDTVPAQDGKALIPYEASTTDLPTRFHIGIYSVPNIPFQHAVQWLPNEINENILASIYHDLLSHLTLGQESAHNLILVKDWIMVIPRRTGWIGDLGANAAAMIGMVWMTSEQDYEGWTKQDPMLLLPTFGVPVEASSS